MILGVFIAGNPAPQGSKRLFNGIMVEANSRTKEWRADVRAALIREDGTPREYFDGPVQVIAQFVMPRPKSAPKKRAATADKKPDLDKLLRAVLDAISSSGMWRDDCQVVQITAEKKVAAEGETPGLRLWVHPWQTESRLAVHSQ